MSNVTKRILELLLYRSLSVYVGMFHVCPCTYSSSSSVFSHFSLNCLLSLWLLYNVGLWSMVVGKLHFKYPLMITCQLHVYMYIYIYTVYWNNLSQLNFHSFQYLYTLYILCIIRSLPGRPKHVVLNTNSEYNKKFSCDWRVVFVYSMVVGFMYSRGRLNVL